MEIGLPANINSPAFLPISSAIPLMIASMDTSVFEDVETKYQVEFAIRKWNCVAATDCKCRRHGKLLVLSKHFAALMSLSGEIDTVYARHA